MTGKGARYVHPGGEFESVNPIVDNPPKVDVQNRPTPADVNFQLRNFLFECDHISMDEQIAQAKRLVALGVINRVVESGGKSLHMICTPAISPATKDEYKWLFRHIVEKYNINDVDFMCANPGRLTRRPNMTRTDTGRLQTLLHESNNTLTLPDWRPLYQKYQAQQIIEHQKAMAFCDSLKKSESGRTQYREWALANVRANWHDGNRHAMLFNQTPYGTHSAKNYKCRGIVNDLIIAGLGANEISALLCDPHNRKLSASVLWCVRNSVFRSL
jgi:hypothetical protein